jgi:hypothetical protein
LSLRNARWNLAWRSPSLGISTGWWCRIDVHIDRITIGTWVTVGIAIVVTIAITEAVAQAIAEPQSQTKSIVPGVAVETITTTIAVESNAATTKARAAARASNSVPCTAAVAAGWARQAGSGCGETEENRPEYAG